MASGNNTGADWTSLLLLWVDGRNGSPATPGPDAQQNKKTGNVGELAPAPGADEAGIDDLEDGTVTGRASMSNVQNPADASVGQTAEPEENIRVARNNQHRQTW